MLRRCIDKILLIIPNTQPAYQQGQSTTELVFSMKDLAEKAITSENYEIMLLLFDMSKAFDTVRRNELFKILKEVFDDDDLHMMKVLVEHFKLKVKIGNEIGNDIHTNIGIPLSSLRWTELHPLILLSIRTTIKTDIDCSPAQLVYGTTPFTFPPMSTTAHMFLFAMFDILGGSYVITSYPIITSGFWLSVSSLFCIFFLFKYFIFSLFKYSSSLSRIINYLLPDSGIHAIGHMTIMHFCGVCYTYSA